MRGSAVLSALSFSKPSLSPNNLLSTRYINRKVVKSKAFSLLRIIPLSDLKIKVVASGDIHRNIRRVLNRLDNTPEAESIARYMEIAADLFHLAGMFS